MPQAFESDELLVRYHLGELSPEERDAVEGRFFVDDEFHEQVLAAEEDLIDSYVHNELSAEQRKHFEDWFLPVDDRREKLEFAKALARYLHQGESENKRRLTSYLRALKQHDPDAEKALSDEVSRSVESKLQARLGRAELVQEAIAETCGRVRTYLYSAESLDPDSLLGFVHAACRDAEREVRRRRKGVVPVWARVHHDLPTGDAVALPAIRSATDG